MLILSVCSSQPAQKSRSICNENEKVPDMHIEQINTIQQPGVKKKTGTNTINTYNIIY